MTKLDNIEKVLEITSLFRKRKYNDMEWKTILVRSYDEGLYKFLNTTPKWKDLFNKIKPFLDGESIVPEIYLEKDKGIGDLEHLMATLEGYVSSTCIVPRYWCGWGGDLATIMAEVQNQTITNTNTYELVTAMNYIGDVNHSFSYPDICSDADSIGIAKILKGKKERDEHILSNTLQEYYDNYASNRYNYFLEDIYLDNEMEGLNLAIKEKMEKRILSLEDIFPGIANVIELKGNNASEKVINACCMVFSEYIATEL